MLMICIPTASADSSISLVLSQPWASVGDKVTASGTTSPNSWVPIKVIDETESILVFDTGKGDETGNYSIDFLIPDNAAGILTVVVGEGANVISRTITVVQKGQGIAVTGVSINEGNQEVAEGKTVQLTATVQPENATIKDVTWRSSDASVATVNETGLITAAAKGEVTITVTTVDGGLTDTIQVSVEQVVETNISMSLSKTTAYAGDGITASGVALPGAWVPIKVTDEAGNILLFDTGKADELGNYSIDFIISDDASGTLTVVVGEGSNVSSQTITIIAVDECFIATAAYGSKYDWPVALLRTFRDQYLLTNSIGTAFVDFYYQHSPPIAEIISSSPVLKILVRVLLAPAIAVIYIAYHPITMVMVLGLIVACLLYRQRLKRSYS